MASVTALGSASGLPLDNVLKDLKAAEDRRLTLIQDKQNAANACVSAYGQIKSAVEGVRDAANKLSDPKTFGAVKSSVVGSSVSAAASVGAVAGQYFVQVNTLATAQTLQLQTADPNAAIGAGGSITFTLADGTAATVAVGNDSSLKGIVKTINTTDGVGVRASILNDGNGNSYLMLMAKNTGMQAVVSTITVDGNADLSALLAFDGNGNPDLFNLKQSTPAADASITINGIPVTSGSNKLTSAIDNVTLTLTNVGASTINISDDSTPAFDAVSAFIKAYDTLQTTFATLTAYDADKKIRGDAFGETSVRLIQSSLASATRVSLSEGNLRTLGQLGITTDPKTNKLNLDKTKWDKALASDPNGVIALLSGEKGLATQVLASSKNILATDGTIATRTRDLSRTVSTLQKQYKSAERSIDSVMNNYRNQFTKLDAYVGRMKATSEKISQAFASMRPQTK